MRPPWGGTLATVPSIVMGLFGLLVFVQTLRWGFSALAGAITPFPGGGPKWQVSTTGGIYPKWRGDGKELYFITYGGNMTAVDVATTAASVTLGTPHVLFTTTLEGLNWGPYDVSRDGKQFLLNGTAAQDSDTPLTLVTNWLSEIKK